MAGGTDVGTGEAFTGTLTAPAGSTVINPLTTIIQAIVNAGNSVADAETIVQTALGLPEVDLLSYDPIAALSSDDDTAVSEAKEVFAQHSAIQTTLTTVANTIAAHTDDTEEATVSDKVADQIAAIMLATPNVEVNITDDSNVEDIIQETADATNTTIDNDLIVAIADNVELVANTITVNIEESNTTDLVAIRTVAAQIATVVESNNDTLTTAIDILQN